MKFITSIITTVLCIISLCAGSCWAGEFTREQAGRIAQTFAKILEQGHYKSVQIDDSISKQFLKNYLDALDPNHLIFTQKEIGEFESKYSVTLDDLVKAGDVTPGYEMFSAYLKKLENRQLLVEELLKETVDFNKEESFSPQRNKEPWPKDENEARELWRLRVKFELLADRLAKLRQIEEAKSKPDTKAKPGKTETSPSQPSIKQSELNVAKPYDPSQTISTISKRYKRLLRAMKEFDSEEILQTYLTSLSHAYDPHSDYMGPTEASNFEINNVKLSLSGIGALLRSEDGVTKIVSVVPGGPAALSKQLHENDQIIAVAQGTDEPVDTIDMKLNKVVDMIRGTKGTEVRLTIIPSSSVDGSERKVLSLIRDEIKLTEQQAKSKVYDHLNESKKAMRLGVVTLPTFYENCSKDIEKLTVRLKEEGIQGMVLDLRRNGGGLLPEAIKLTGLFITNGPVVQVKSSDKRTELYQDKNYQVAYNGPLVVLVSHLSASASEIVSAALQDYGRAVIVGDQTTHGKGTVQTLLSMNQYMRPGVVTNSGKIKFTVSKFYRVAGGTTQRNGVTPDIIMPSLLDQMDLGEASLPNALPADFISPVPYNRLNQVEPVLGELRRRSGNRILANQDFSYLREDIERYRKQKTEKSISLNEKQRLKELEEEKIRKESRKTERAQRPKTLEKVFELTLDTVTKGKEMVPMKLHSGKDNEQLASNDTSKSTAKADNGDVEDSDSEKEPDTDAHLDEALRILRDLIQIHNSSSGKSQVEARLNF